MKLQKAKQIADKLVSELKPYCERIDIAGGIRRGKPDPHDIEICCIPNKKSHFERNDLFGVVEKVTYRNPLFDQMVESFGKVIKGKRNGRMMQIQLPEIMLDLFTPDPIDYIRQFAIRTGSAEYSFKTIAASWKRLGWVGTKDGLRLQKDCTAKAGGDNKTIWVVNVLNPTLPPKFQSELEFFDWLKIPYKEPKDRL